MARWFQLSTTIHNDRSHATRLARVVLQAVREQAVLRGCGRYEWSVLNWNQRAIDFYEKDGRRTR